MVVCCVVVVVEFVCCVVVKYVDEFGFFMKYEVEFVMCMSFKVVEVVFAAARSVSEMKDDRNFVERVDVVVYVILDVFVVVGKGIIIFFRLVFKIVVCLFVYMEFVV